jgi:hypothetical protein
LHEGISALLPFLENILSRVEMFFFEFLPRSWLPLVPPEEGEPKKKTGKNGERTSTAEKRY